MVKTLIVHGHGGFDCADGLIWIPPNVSLEFYTEGGKTMPASFAYEYFLGSGLPLTGGGPDLVIGPEHQAFNYTLSGLGDDLFKQAQAYWAKGNLINNPDYRFFALRSTSSVMKLSQIVELTENSESWKGSEKKIVWMACRVVALKKNTGKLDSKALGFNTRQENRSVHPRTLLEHELEAEYQRMLRENP